MSAPVTFLSCTQILEWIDFFPLNVRGVGRQSKLLDQDIEDGAPGENENQWVGFYSRKCAQKPRRAET